MTHTLFIAAFCSSSLLYKPRFPVLLALSSFDILHTHEHCFLAHPVCFNVPLSCCCCCCCCCRSLKKRSQKTCAASPPLPSWVVLPFYCPLPLPPSLLPPLASRHYLVLLLLLLVLLLHSLLLLLLLLSTPLLLAPPPPSLPLLFQQRSP